MRASLGLVPARPYSLTRTTSRFARFPDEIDRADERGYRRMLIVEGRPLLVRVHQSGPPSRARLEIALEGKGARRASARRAAERLAERALGARDDVRPFYRAFAGDPLLAGPIREFRGLRVAGSATLFEAILTAVLSQQVNLRFAYSIRDDLARRFGESVRFGGVSYTAFPAPERIARETPGRLRRLRLSRAKAETIVRVARAFASGELDEHELRARDDEEVIERLTALKGIGRWTAETALMRGLGRPDAFPAADLGVVKYLARGLLGRRAPSTERQMRAFSERWRPWRSLALVYAYAELARRRAAD
jgi:DNA-3-methyladenine glycosylase II